MQAPVSSSTAEWRLLLACSRRTPRPVDGERISERIAERCDRSAQGPSLDWSAFLKLVARHRVAPLVWSSLQSLGGGTIPERVRSELQPRVERGTLSALRYSGELVRLARRFEDAGVPMLSLKGPALAVQLYGDLKYRQGRDLDLLIDPTHAADAHRLLEEAGYVRSIPDYPLSSGQAAAFMRVRKDFSYVHSSTRTLCIELHWRLTQNARLLPLTFESLWAERASVSLAGHPVPVIAKRDLLLYLCAHGAHTGWFRLKWLCDVAELIDDTELDLSPVVTRARQLGLGRVLAQGILLAHQVLEAPLPEALPPEWREDRIVRRLVAVGRDALLQDERNWSADETPLSWMPTQMRYRLALRRELRYKLHNLYFYSLWSDDCRRIRLPKLLFLLYYPLSIGFTVGSLLRR